MARSVAPRWRYEYDADTISRWPAAIIVSIVQAARKQLRPNRILISLNKTLRQAHARAELRR